MNRICTCGWMLVFSLVICSGVFAGGTAEPEEPVQETTTTEAATEAESESLYPPYLALVDGLHVTGTPIEVDIDTYRLEIVGLVEEQGSYTFDEIKAMPSRDIGMALICPGFFEDTGVWTGTPLLALLEHQGIKKGARSVKFISIDQLYYQELNLSELYSRQILVAWAFNGEEFPAYHGFPLRIAAGDLPGAIWVKWLGTIVVR